MCRLRTPSRAARRQPWLDYRALQLIAAGHTHSVHVVVCAVSSQLKDAVVEAVNP